MKHPLSEKQILSYKESTKRLNVWEGSVRSGKSFISILRFIKELRNGPPGMCMIIGSTRDSVQRNVLAELCGLLGFPEPTPKATQMVVFGRTIYLVGASDERAQRRIQGSTLAMAYVDELALIPEGFFKMLLSRLSVTGAKLFGTTNPDSPFHWLKTEFLDNPNIEIANWKFKIEDNPSLSKEYIDSLKTEYQGLWYKRYIDGEWVLAEGTVYDFFNVDDHVIQSVGKRGKYYIIGVDYGTANPTVYSLIGYDPSQYPNIWLEKEYYYDSRKHNRQKTDTEYAEDLIDFIGTYNVQHIYIDPSAASFKAELFKQGVDKIYDADNDVINGIRFVSQLMCNGTFKVCSSCVNTIKEFSTYVWDVKASERGEDKPVKQHDHCFAAGTPILTSRGNVPIEDVEVGDLVRTRSGYNKVLKLFVHKAKVITLKVLGKTIKCTPDHRFYTTNGWREAKDLEGWDVLIECRNNALYKVRIETYHKQLEIIDEGEECEVYNIHVNNEHEFFAHNILSHNCMDSLRYSLFTHFGQDMGSTIKPEDIDKMYNEANQKQDIPAVFQQPHDMMGGSYY